MPTPRKLPLLKPSKYNNLRLDIPVRPLLIEEIPVEEPQLVVDIAEPIEPPKSTSWCTIQ